MAIIAKTIDKRIFCHIKLLTTIQVAPTSPAKELIITKINGATKKTKQRMIYGNTNKNFLGFLPIVGLIKTNLFSLKTDFMITILFVVN